MITIKSHNELDEGLFGGVILWIIEILPILEKKNINIKTLKWDIIACHYGKIFPNILEDRSIKNNTDNHTTLRLKDLRNEIPQYTLGDDFEKINKLFFKYFQIPKYLYDIASSYNLKNYLGIHYRGLDKTYDSNENTPMTKEDLYIILDSYIQKNSIKKIFISTDESDILVNLKNKYPTIQFKSSRNINNNYFHKQNIEDIQKKGREAIIDMLCLSQCHTVLKTSSALSAFAKVINPKLNIYRFNASKMFADVPYFPDAYIPMLKTETDYSQECNQVLKKIQIYDWTSFVKNKFNNFYIKERL